MLGGTITSNYSAYGSIRIASTHKKERKMTASVLKQDPNT